MHMGLMLTLLSMRSCTFEYRKNRENKQNSIDIFSPLKDALVSYDGIDAFFSPFSDNVNNLPLENLLMHNTRIFLMLVGTVNIFM